MHHYNYHHHYYFPFCKLENWGTEEVSDLPEVQSSEVKELGPDQDSLPPDCLATLLCEEV